MNKNILLVAFLMSFISYGQQNRWQQRILYQMDIDMDVKTFTFDGTQKITYYNNSPDTLKYVYYHLYFNAFQPGSMMDVRSRTIIDPDRRVRDRISKLKYNEIGYQKILSLKQNGKKLKYKIEDTILEVKLNEPILPKSKEVFTMKFKGQVPKQIRRSGRQSAEGVELSMTQWYPKMAEYDFEGWHANPYVGREFHGVWGDFDIKITIDKDYVIGSTGYVQNPNEVGHGYGNTQKPKNGKITWHFVAPNVHDFAWAADPDYVHDKVQVPGGPMLHFIYQSKSLDQHKQFVDITANWKKVQSYTVDFFREMEKKFGPYPYKQYTIVQGGDGGMEYAMCTLVTGDRSFESLIGVIMHEIAHSWFQHVLATNESKFAWMDEGFTSYVETLLYHKLVNKRADNPFKGYRAYVSLAKSGREEPMSTHADHFNTNYAYGRASYTKGSVFLAQLGYIIGEKNLDKTMKRYYSTWKFKHPNDNDFKRIAEKISGIHLGWYLDYWKNTTHSIDYAVESVVPNDKNSVLVTMKRIGKMPMPIDVLVTYKDGKKQWYYVPLGMMRGEKPNETNQQRVLLKDWYWTHPLYQFEIPIAFDKIKNVQIDPKQEMADVERLNNNFLKDDINIGIKGN